MIKDFRALLGNTQDAMHCMAICRAMLECIQHHSYFKCYLSADQLHAMDLIVHHGIDLQVVGLDGEPISEMCQCTEIQSWRLGD
jgi:hypothetical protein